MKIFLAYESIKIEIPSYESEQIIYLCDLLKSNRLQGNMSAVDGTAIIHGTGTNDSIISILTKIQDESYNSYYEIE